MSTIIISDNGLYIKLYTRSTESIRKIRRHFTYKISKWVNRKLQTYDICLLEKNKYLLKGLLDELLIFLEEEGIEFEIEKSLLSKNNLPNDLFDNFLRKLNPNPFPRDYQQEAVKEVLRNKMRTVLSVTSSGKSLMAYLLCMFYMVMNTNKKCLIIVPGISLVSQMFNDFIKYSENNDKIDIKKFTKRLSGISKDKIIGNEQIIISNWEYLQNKPKEFFEDFGLLIYDEVHKSNAKQSRKIISNCVNVDYKMGLSGTIPEDLIIKYKTVQGLMGPIHHAISYKEMIEEGYSCDLKIYPIILNHGKFKKYDYKTEINNIISSDKRNQFLINVINKLNGNTLVLFRTAKSPFPYGRSLIKSLKKYNKKLFYIDGDISDKDREQFKEKLEKNDNCVLVASYATIGTGISINNIHNVVFAESLKSEISILQAIGRGLRLHDSKDHVKIIDIVDKFEYNDRFKPYGYVYGHFLLRERYYINQEFDYYTKEFDL